MDFESLKRLVNELDIAVSKESAKVQLRQYGGPDESCMVATPRGYLRFGIELMKAGLAEKPSKKKGSRPIEVDIGYLMTDDSTVNFDSFELTDEIAVEDRKQNWSDKLFIYTILGILIALPILAVVGLVTVIRAVF